VNSSDATVGDVTSWPPRIKEEVGKWLSDWHLVSFLCYQGLFTLVRLSFLINLSTFFIIPLFILSSSSSPDTGKIKADM
jgi:hypothetical protein